jgi:hypothetical protein
MHRIGLICGALSLAACSPAMVLTSTAVSATSGQGKNWRLVKDGASASDMSRDIDRCERAADGHFSPDVHTTACLESLGYIVLNGFHPKSWQYHPIYKDGVLVS